MELDSGKSLIPVVAVGDSLTSLAADPTVSWFGYANSAIGDPCRFINAGAGGERTDQILARVATDVVAKNPRFCIVLAGANDVGQGVAAATIQGYLSDIYDALEAADLPFVACTITPREVDPGEEAILQDVNDWMRSNVESGWANAVLCDWSPSLTVGGEDWVPITGLLTDTVHFTGYGANVAGRAFTASLAEMVALVTA